MRYTDLHLRIPRPELKLRWMRWLLPTPGNVIFTLLVISSLLWAQNAGAINLTAPVVNSSLTIPYQGRLANASGAPFTGNQNIEFRLYNAPSGGTPLWTEFWTGGNAVNVSDGLFSVLLGSLQSGLPGVVQSNSQLWLGITVGTDGEMSPRVQLGSAAYSMQALTVPDGSITNSKLAAGSVGTTTLADSSVGSAKLAENSVSLTKLVDNSVNSAKIQDGTVATSDLADSSVNKAKLSNDVTKITLLPTPVMMLYKNVSTPATNTWYDLDLSSTVPVTAKAALLDIGAALISGNAVRLSVAKPGGGYEFTPRAETRAGWNFSQGWTPISNQHVHYQFAPLGSNDAGYFYIQVVGYME